MLNILKDNGMTITRENINKLTAFKNKIQYIVDNATPSALDHLTSIENIDTESIDSIFNELKNIADSIPLNNEELKNLDMDEIINNLKDINPDEENLKDIVSSIIKNNLPPTKNNVNRVDTILKNVETIKDLNGKTVGYIVKNNIDITINNLMKAKLSFDNLGSIMGNYRGATSGAYTPNSISGTVPISSSDIDNLSEDINRILTLEGLPADEKNINAAKILIQNDMDISRKNVTKITSIIDNVTRLSEEMDSDVVVNLIKSNVDIQNIKIDTLLNYAATVKEKPDNGKEFRLDSFGLRNSNEIEAFFKAQASKNINSAHNEEISNIINSLNEVSLSDIASLLKNGESIDVENLLKVTKAQNSPTENLSEAQIKATLASLKLSATEENLNAAKALLANKMNISRNAIDKLITSKNYLDSFCDSTTKNLNAVANSLPDNWETMNLKQLNDVAMTIPMPRVSSSYDIPASDPLKLKLDTKRAEENIKDI
jgi:DNA-directed RNA polymerase subunit F